MKVIQINLISLELKRKIFDELSKMSEEETDWFLVTIYYVMKYQQTTRSIHVRNRRSVTGWRRQIHADCNERLRVPNRGVRPLIRDSSFLPAASHRCTLSERATNCLRCVKPPRLCIRCPKPILEAACDINRQGRQDESRDGRYLVGGRIKPIETKHGGRKHSGWGSSSKSE